MPDTKITFLGTAAVLPGAYEDTACFLVNGTLLFDCGWNAVLRMQQFGYDPVDVETLFFTHCHHDHYLGLPGLLFFRAMRATRGDARPPLEIIGPPDDLPLVLDLAHRLLQPDRFPRACAPAEMHPLEPGATYETDAFRIETVRALHPVTAVSARFTDKASGVIIAFSGDTAPNPQLARLARGADLLVHEASVRPDLPDGQLRGDHSRATDAARIARDAGVKRLLLVHLAPEHREASAAAAKTIFAESRLAGEGETLVLRR
jgi:ribonuclease Z